jgi:Spy/CpxP family protein refolding chaperone
MLKQKIITIAVIILLVLNSIALALVWFNKSGPPRNARPHGADEFLTKELNLTPAQHDSYDSMHKAFREQMDNTEQELHKAKDELFDNISAPYLDSIQVDSLSAIVGKIEATQDKLTIAHFRQIRKILDVQQQQKFDNIIKEALHKMAPPQMPPPPHE